MDEVFWDYGLHDEGELFASAVESGEVAEAMARVDRFETLDDVQRWATREFFASGGHPLHFQRHVKALMDRHLERLNHSTLRKMRLPIPGGRYYVMPQAVGRLAMNWAIKRSLANQGALGMYCNSLMVNKAVFDDLPASPPAPLEDIIDSSVKSGADLSRVVGWNYDNSRRILESRTPIPALLHDRLSRDFSDCQNLPPRPLPAADHWLDRTERVIKQHIAHMQTHRDELVARAMPPRQVFDSVFDDPQALDWGAKFNAAYGKTLAQTRRDFDAAREASETYLARFPEEDHGRILRGAIASSYMSADKDGKPLSDAALWQRGAETESGERLPGIAHKTLVTLREIGALDEIGETSEGVVAYPGALVPEPAVQTLGIRGVWFNLHKAQAKAASQSVPENLKMRDVSKSRRVALKNAVEEQSQTTYRDIVLRVEQSKSGQLVAYTEEGNLFGKLQHADDDLQPGDRIRLHHTRARDGNLRATYSKLPPQETA